VSLCTEDVTVSQQCDNALDCEYGFAKASLGLSHADLAELAQNSLACSPWQASPEAKGAINWYSRHEPDPPRSSSKTSKDSAEGGHQKEEENKQARKIRYRYRHARRDVELSLVSSLAQRAHSRKQQ